MIPILIALRDKFNFIFKKIYLIEKDNEIIHNYLIFGLINLLCLFNLNYILSLLNIKILYKIDNLFFYDDFKNNNKPQIKPIILSVNISNDSKQLELTDIIKNYDMNIPLYLFFYNENIDKNEYTTMNIETLKNFKRAKLIYQINDINNKKIAEII
jgi:hypothetical protein